MRWLAERTRRTPEELTASPAGALRALADAAGETAELARRAASDDPEVSAAAMAEADSLRAQFTQEPPASERFGRRVAQILREAAERLDRGPDAARASSTSTASNAADRNRQAMYLSNAAGRVRRLRGGISPTLVRLLSRSVSMYTWGF
jgi:hypothetical protein